MAEPATLHAEDVLPVRSRISWGAIFAGVFVAVAVHVLLSVLGAACGFSVSRWARGDQLAGGAAVWAIVTTLIALFVGGWVTSQCTAGENKMEAALYGIILWGLMFTMLLWLATSTAQFGLSALIGTATARGVNQDVTGSANWADVERSARDAGVSQADIDKMKKGWPSTTADLRRATEDPDVRREATKAAWWSFAGVILSMIASVAGALAGAGPASLLRGFLVRTTRTPSTGVPYPSR